jgi:hypothetical protein
MGFWGGIFSLVRRSGIFELGVFWLFFVVFFGQGRWCLYMTSSSYGEVGSGGVVRSGSVPGMEVHRFAKRIRTKLVSDQRWRW